MDDLKIQLIRLVEKWYKISNDMISKSKIRDSNVEPLYLMYKADAYAVCAIELQRLVESWTAQNKS